MYLIERKRPDISEEEAVIRLAREALDKSAAGWFSSKEEGYVRYRANFLDSPGLMNELKVFIKKAECDDENAKAILCGYAGLILQKGEALSGELAEYISNVLLDLFFVREKVPRGGDAMRNAARDMFILFWLSSLEKAGFFPTRNDSLRNDKRRLSGSALLTPVLNNHGFNIKVRAVEKVWEKREAKKELKV